MELTQNYTGLQPSLSDFWYYSKEYSNKPWFLCIAPKVSNWINVMCKSTELFHNTIPYTHKPSLTPIVPIQRSLFTATECCTKLLAHQNSRCCQFRQGWLLTGQENGEGVIGLNPFLIIARYSQNLQQFGRSAQLSLSQGHVPGTPGLKLRTLR